MIEIFFGSLFVLVSDLVIITRSQKSRQDRSFFNGKNFKVLIVKNENRVKEVLQKQVPLICPKLIQPLQLCCHKEIKHFWGFGKSLLFSK
jgi:hypothetical protein